MIQGLILLVSSWANILALSGGTLLGIFIGALPGLGPAAAIAIAIPLTYFVDPVVAMLLLLGIYIGGIYGGSMTAILLNTPGTPNSAATLLDGFPMAQQGLARKALITALIASTIGGTISAVALLIIAPLLATIALKFGPAEYFSIVLFALTIIGLVSGVSLLKGLITASLGLFLSTVGLCPISGTPRFTFGSINLLSGLSVIAMLIGVFALSEVLIQAENAIKHSKQVTYLRESEIQIDRRVSFLELVRMKWLLLRSSLVGIFIGILPGIGAVTASFVSYGLAKRYARKIKMPFGKGAIEGVAAAEAANNAVTGAALIPLLVLGIPGDVVTAILLGALVIHGLVPGPGLFQSQSPIVYAIITGLILGNLIMFIIGWFFLKGSVFITKTARYIVFPIVVVLCVAGAYAINNNGFDLIILFIFTIVGYFMRKWDFPIPPFIIAFILGPMAEINLRQAMIISDGSMAIFIQKPISLVFLVLTAISVLKLLVNRYNEMREA